MRKLRKPSKEALRVLKTQGTLIKEIQKSIPEGFECQVFEGRVYHVNPDGTSAVPETGFGCQKSDKTVFIRNADNTIYFLIQISKEKTGRSKLVEADGHTYFFDETLNTWRSFDRLGVSDSFYIMEILFEPIAQVLLEQLMKVYETRDVSKFMVSVPTIPFRMHKDRISQVSEELKSGKSHSFMPSGFGTGYVISARPLKFGNVGKNELAKFFNLESIYVRELECD